MWEWFSDDFDIGDCILVMEDDCHLCANFKEQVYCIVSKLQKTKPHWRLCLLGSHELGSTLCSRRATLASRDVQQGQLSTGLFAYLLHRRALPLLLSAITGAFPLAEQLDVALSSLEWGHCSRFTVATALVASPLSQEGDSDVQLLGDTGARAHASLPSPVRDRLIGSDPSAHRASELTGPPAQRRSAREVHPPDRSHLLLPPANIPSVKELSETNDGFRGMPVRVADVGSEKGKMLIANRRIASGCAACQLRLGSACVCVLVALRASEITFASHAPRRAAGVELPTISSS